MAGGLRRVLLALVAASIATGSTAAAPDSSGDRAKTYRASVVVKGRPAPPTGFESLGVGSVLDSSLRGGGTFSVLVPAGASPHRPQAAAGKLELRHTVERGPQLGASLRLARAFEVWPGGRWQYRSSEGVRLLAQVTATNIPGCKAGDTARVQLNRRPKLLVVVEVCQTNVRYEPTAPARPAVTVSFTPALK